MCHSISLIFQKDYKYSNTQDRLIIPSIYHYPNRIKHFLLLPLQGPVILKYFIYQIVFYLLKSNYIIFLSVFQTEDTFYLFSVFQICYCQLNFSFKMRFDKSFYHQRHTVSITVFEILKIDYGETAACLEVANNHE